MPFPVAKLGYLAIKQLSKPVANAIKSKAKQSPFLRNRILLRPAQWLHTQETRVRMRLLGLGQTKKSTVKPLTDQQAVDLGAEMLGEIILFTVGTGVIALEYIRQVRNEANKEDVQNTRLVEMESRLLDLTLQVEQQGVDLRVMQRQQPTAVPSEPSPAEKDASWSFFGKSKPPQTSTSSQTSNTIYTELSIASGQDEVDPGVKTS